MQDPESIEQAIPHNGRHRDAMLHLIKSGEAIAFVGAGLSQPLYPAWSGFLRQLAEEAGKTTGKEFVCPSDVRADDLLKYAEAVKEHCRIHDPSLNNYYQIIGRAFQGAPTRCTDKQKKLVRLPFRGFVTTNYDDALEEALLLAGIKSADCGVVIKRDEDHCENV